MAKKYRLRYMPPQNGKRITCPSTGNTYLWQSRSMGGPDVADVDEADLGFLMSYQYGGCCGRGPSPMFQVLSSYEV